jgi:hypothetical protein
VWVGDSRFERFRFVWRRLVTQYRTGKLRFWARKTGFPVNIDAAILDGSIIYGNA